MTAETVTGSIVETVTVGDRTIDLRPLTIRQCASALRKWLFRQAEAIRQDWPRLGVSDHNAMDSLIAELHAAHLTGETLADMTRTMDGAVCVLVEAGHLDGMTEDEAWLIGPAQALRLAPVLCGYDQGKAGGPDGRGRQTGQAWTSTVESGSAVPSGT
jgi:hypothetical protein